MNYAAQAGAHAGIFRKGEPSCLKKFDGGAAAARFRRPLAAQTIRDLKGAVYPCFESDTLFLECCLCCF